jgi:hypothetical protein
LEIIIMKSAKILGFTTVFFCSLALISCGGGGGSDEPDTEVRVVHLSPDAPAVDALIDDGRVLENASFPSGSEYLPVSEGTRNVKVNVTGTSTTVIESDVDLAKGKRYSVAAINKVAAIEPLVLIDEIHTSQGNAAIRVVHAAPSAPNVDVYATAPDADIANSTPVLANVPFKTSSGYLSVPPGNYRFRVTPAGNKTVVIDSGTVALGKDQTFTAFARDAVGGGAPFGLLLLKDSIN